MKDIVDLIAVDQPIMVVTRLIDIFNAVVNYKSGTNESINVYVSKFQGLASEHLMRAGTTNSDQIGEVLAITMLNNANLSSKNLNQAKMHLINLSQPRASGEPNFELHLTAESKKGLKHQWRKLQRF